MCEPRPLRLPLIESFAQPTVALLEIIVPPPSIIIPIEDCYQDGLFGPVIPIMNPIKGLFKVVEGIVARPGRSS